MRRRPTRSRSSSSPRRRPTTPTTGAGSRRIVAVAAALALAYSGGGGGGCVILSGASAAVACNDSSTCESLLRPGSECVGGRCTNPFVGGCLRGALGRGHDDSSGGGGGGRRPPWPPARTCNSDDPLGASESGLCSYSAFDYPEIRISPGNWESSIFITWVLQILLSELVNVPATVETGMRDESTGERIPGATSSFYSPTMDFTFAAHTYNWGGIREAHRVPGGDCRRTSRDCCHVMPEVWSGQITEINRAVGEGYVEPASSLDIVGKLGIYVPRFTAARDPSLTSMLGLSGESNRAKLARVFKRPTTWGTYCSEVSPTNCSDAEKEYDGVARRRPADDDEGGKYYAEGVYRGHFRYTAKNDCGTSASPRKCTGHFVDPICEWSTYTQGQIFWNDIALSSDGGVPPYGSYTWAEMIQIWTAANETGSDVIMYWWRPDWVPHVFRGGPGELVPVTLAEPNEECALARIDTEAKCSSNATVRRGTARGSCDYEPYVLKKVIVSSLRRSAHDAAEVDRSPAYELIRAFRMTDLVVDMMLRLWIERAVDKYGYDPREVVCNWVAQNLDQLRQFVPEGYPRRIVRDSSYERGFLYAAMGVGAFTVCVTMATAVVAYCIRQKKVIRYAQPLFLMLILVGFLLVACGAVLFAAEPSEASCIVRNWLIMLGYSLELVPLITKVAAINKMMQHAKKLRRVQVEKKNMLGAAAVVIVLVLVYLSVWTALDPPTRQEQRVLTRDLTEAGEAYVEVRVECSSSSDSWAIGAMGWQVVQLLCATVLGFQNRTVRQEFNESQRLCFMVYSHFFFVSMRLVTVFVSDIIQPNVLAGVTSFLLSFDTLVTLLIYFVPKFREAISPQAPEPPLTDVEAIRRHASQRPKKSQRLLEESRVFSPQLSHDVAAIRRRSSRRSSNFSVSEMIAEDSVDSQKHPVFSNSSGLLAENVPSDNDISAGQELPSNETGTRNEVASSKILRCLAFWRKSHEKSRKISSPAAANETEDVSSPEEELCHYQKEESREIKQDSLSSLREVRFEEEEES